MVARPRSNDMQSTWRQDRSQWGYAHWLIHLLRLEHAALDQDIPVHAKTDPVPFISQWQNHRWILLHAAWPLALHQAYCSWNGKGLPPWAVFAWYTGAFLLNAIHQLNIARRFAHMYGFLDGDKHARDDVPDNSVAKVLHSLTLTAILRPLMSLLLTYRRDEAPISISPWVILEIGLYGIILDFWFYWYHRAMHQVESLWKYHRTHHLTKHPNPLLTLFADTEQEAFDMIGIPLLAYTTMRCVGLPMNFYDWWVCHQYTSYAELWGHSGLRIHGTPASTLAWLLDYFDAGLVIEDHDLHHRHGWKKSHNYGKQTRLWDRMFGTCHERIESIPSNVDMTRSITMPLL